MRFLLVIFLFEITASIASAESPSKQPSFRGLRDALGFIDTKLDKHDWVSLKAALYPSYERGEYYRTSWDYLRDVRGHHRLSETKGLKEFPLGNSNTGFCTIDIDDKVRIEFTEFQGKWYLTEIAGNK